MIAKSFSLFLKKTLHRWAQQTGFIVRKKALRAYDFLVLMTVGHVGMKHPSLAGMVDAINTPMSRVGLHYRFTKKAVAFLDKCLRFLLQQKANEFCSIQANLLKPFRRVLIFDSSSWEVHPQLQQVLPGSGGSASKANCKIQVGYEYKHGELCFSQICPGTKPDNDYTDHLPPLLQTNDLLLTDLGYFKLKTYRDIDHKGAFFISRYQIGTILQNPETMATIKLEHFLSQRQADTYHIQVILGDKERTGVCCRLICLRVSEQVATQHRRQLKEKAQKKGRIPSKRQLLFCDWILMVTNVPEEWLPPEMVRPLYSLRWQIELLFKQLKSVLRIHQSNTGNEYRLRCEVYGKLIMAILIHRIHAVINSQLWNIHRRELSMDKLYKRIQERAFMLTQLLLNSLKKAVTYLSKEIGRLIKNCMKYKQLSRKTTLEILEKGRKQYVEELLLAG